MSGLKLLLKKKRSQGRNNRGRITVYHRGGRGKIFYRIIDFQRNFLNLCGKIVKVEEDPYRGGKIGLIAYSNGYLSYILLSEGLNVGDIVGNNDNLNILGNSVFLSNLSVGNFVHSIELKEFKGAQLCRAAGNFGVVLSKGEGKVQIALRSGKVVNLNNKLRCVVGVVSNIDKNNEIIGKAGRSRWLGRRPVVRGVAMNPVDHPHGGGEGKTSGGRHPVTPWGKLTKGKKTVKK